MKKRDLQNEKLDEIARRLLATTRPTDGELDRIVASPKLFDGVQARIKAEQQRERASDTSFGDWRNLFVWNGQKTGAALAVLMFLAFGTLGLIVLTQRNSSTPTVRQINPPPQQIQTPDAPVDIPPPVENHEAPPEIVKTKDSGRKNRLNLRKAVLKNEIVAAPKAKPRKRNPVKRQIEIEPEGEFYALNYPGATTGAGEDLRIIRAELSRSSLFALGVNLPIENESEKIKTDLLVGADGVAKAIRFVK